MRSDSAPKGMYSSSIEFESTRQLGRGSRIATDRKCRFLGAAGSFGRKKMRLIIQITVFLEVLISCILGSEELWFSEWANQPSRTPRNRNPSGWRTEGKSARLAKGMPNGSSTGLKGERF